MAAVEKPSKRQTRYTQTANDFQFWLESNPRANIKRKIQAFNAIADTNYRKAKRRNRS